MPTIHEFVTAVDEYMAATKQIVGVTTPQTWREGRQIGEGELIVRFPVEVNGEQFPYCSFIVLAFPYVDELKFTLTLVYQHAVSRLDYEIDRPHSNLNTAHGPEIPHSVIGPHYHPWRENRATITNLNEPFRLPIALPLDIHVRQFDAALRWFCNQTNIVLRDHAIELPARTRLL